MGVRSKLLEFLEYDIVGVLYVNLLSGFVS